VTVKCKKKRYKGKLCRDCVALGLSANPSSSCDANLGSPDTLFDSLTKAKSLPIRRLYRCRGTSSDKANHGFSYTALFDKILRELDGTGMRMMAMVCKASFEGVQLASAHNFVVNDVIQLTNAPIPAYCEEETMENRVVRHLNEYFHIVKEVSVNRIVVQPVGWKRHPADSDRIVVDSKDLRGKSNCRKSIFPPNWQDMPRVGDYQSREEGHRVKFKGPCRMYTKKINSGTSWRELEACIRTQGS